MARIKEQALKNLHYQILKGVRNENTPPILAKKLNYSPPAIRYHLRRLRGLRLIVNSTPNAKPTFYALTSEGADALIELARELKRNGLREAVYLRPHSLIISFKIVPASYDETRISDIGQHELISHKSWTEYRTVYSEFSISVTGNENPRLRVYLPSTRLQQTHEIYEHIIYYSTLGREHALKKYPFLRISPSFCLERVHLARVNDSLAVNLIQYASEYRGQKVIIDSSTGSPEIEFVDPKTALEDLAAYESSQKSQASKEIENIHLKIRELEARGGIK